MKASFLRLSVLVFAACGSSSSPPPAPSAKPADSAPTPPPAPTPPAAVAQAPMRVDLGHGTLEIQLPPGGTLASPIISPDSASLDFVVGAEHVVFQVDFTDDPFLGAVDQQQLDRASVMHRSSDGWAAVLGDGTVMAMRAKFVCSAIPTTKAAAAQLLAICEGARLVDVKPLSAAEKATMQQQEDAIATAKEDAIAVDDAAALSDAKALRARDVFQVTVAHPTFSPDLRLEKYVRAVAHANGAGKVTVELDWHSCNDCVAFRGDACPEGSPEGCEGMDLTVIVSPRHLQPPTFIVAGEQVPADRAQQAIEDAFANAP